MVRLWKAKSLIKTIEKANRVKKNEGLETFRTAYFGKKIVAIRLEIKWPSINLILEFILRSTYL